MKDWTVENIKKNQMEASRLNTIYVIMASTDRGNTYHLCIDDSGSIVASDFKKIAKSMLEYEYQYMKERCKELHISHIPRKFFKIVEFRGNI